MKTSLVALQSSHCDAVETGSGAICHLLADHDGSHRGYRWTERWNQQSVEWPTAESADEKEREPVNRSGDTDEAMTTTADTEATSARYDHETRQWLDPHGQPVATEPAWPSLHGDDELPEPDLDDDDGPTT